MKGGGNQSRDHLLAIYQAAIGRVSGRSVVGNPLFPGDEAVPVTALGKAARTMFPGATDAREAAADKARELGYQVRVFHARICAEAENVGRRLALELLDADPGVYIWGGEPGMELPSPPGRGGINRHLALAAATVISGCRECFFLSAATGGNDGPGEDAGALVDGGTISRGGREGLEAEACLREADAGRFLEASGDLIGSGATGTDVMDLMIGLKR